MPAGRHKSQTPPGLAIDLRPPGRWHAALTGPTREWGLRLLLLNFTILARPGIVCYRIPVDVVVAIHIKSYKPFPTTRDLVQDAQGARNVLLQDLYGDSVHKRILDMCVLYPTGILINMDIHRFAHP